MLFKKLSVVGLLAVAAFGFTANAATADELQAQITALLAQIAQLQGGQTSSIGCYAFTRDLTDGVSGADVSALQSYLASKGMFSVAPTGYFGPITRASVASWQSANGVMPAVGYFGAISRAKYASVCGAVVVNPPVPGDDDDDDTNGDLEGGAGSVDTYTLLTGLNNEEVGEDEEDVEVAGMEIEVDDGSDIQFTAVRLVFDEGTANQDFEDYASEVSIWLDGEEFARIDADEFDEDNAWTKTISLDDGAIIRAGETGELTVAISGVSNLDSNDATETWTVDFRQVRFEDADGALISEDPSVAARTFSFETFATASDVELKASLEDDSINDAHIINIDATSDTDNVELLSFNLEAEGDSDIDISSIPVLFTATGATYVSWLISDVTLFADGEEIGSETVASSTAATQTVTFDDLDYVVSAGDEIEFVVKATVVSVADFLDEGDTLSAQLSGTEVDAIDAEDESGTDLGTADLTGTAIGDAHAFYDVGIMVTFVSANEQISESTGANNDVGTFTLKYRVEAFDGTVYVSATAAPTIATTILGSQTDATGATLYNLTLGGAATADDVSDLITFSTTGGGVDATGDVELGDGEYAVFTLSVARTNDDVGDAGIFQMLLKAIGWDTDTGDAKANTYTFDLDDYKTTPISLN